MKTIYRYLKNKNELLIPAIYEDSSFLFCILFGKYNFEFKNQIPNFYLGIYDRNFKLKKQEKTIEMDPNFYLKQYDLSVLDLLFCIKKINSKIFECNAYLLFLNEKAYLSIFLDDQNYIFKILIEVMKKNFLEMDFYKYFLKSENGLVYKKGIPCKVIVKKDNFITEIQIKFAERKLLENKKMIIINKKDKEVKENRANLITSSGVIGNNPDKNINENDDPLIHFFKKK